MQTATIVIPCYNEANTLETCVDRLLAIADDALRLEIIIVDDCSSDGSADIADGIAARHSGIRVLRHEVNQGKGAALRTGFAHATSELVAVQDADLEYDPQDLRELIDLCARERADAVFGSRFITGGAHRVLYFWHSLGNTFLTFFSNVMTDLNLSDMETCYKVIRRERLDKITIEENRFGFEPEITAKLSRRGLRIFEKGITYSGRTYEEGKKIGVRDGFRALYCILRYNAPFVPWILQLVLYGVFAYATSAIGFLAGVLGYVGACPVPVVGGFFAHAFLLNAAASRLLFRGKGERGKCTLSEHAAVVGTSVAGTFLFWLTQMDRISGFTGYSILEILVWWKVVTLGMYVVLRVGVFRPSEAS